jgi:phospholipase C
VGAEQGRTPGYAERTDQVALRLTNRGRTRLTVTVRDAYSAHLTRVSLAAGETHVERHSVARTRGWYDLTVSAGTTAEHRYAGHLENGHDSISDPRMGGLI